MADKKSLKTALLLSILMLAICVASMVGSTMAWFTDSVTAERNQIKVGNLDVDLEFSHDGETWHTTQATTKLFNEASLMEPGHAQMIYLRIKNNGSLHLKYQLTLNIIEEIGSINMRGENYMLSDYLMVGAITHEELQILAAQNGQSLAKVMANYKTGQQLICDETHAADDVISPGQGKKFSQAINLLRATTDAATSEIISIPGPDPSQDEEGKEKPNLIEAYLAPQEAQVFALLVHTPEHLDQEINYESGINPPQIKFGIDVVAGQRYGDEAESDSFGSEYDKDAIYPPTISSGKIAGTWQEP